MSGSGMRGADVRTPFLPRLPRLSSTTSVTLDDSSDDDPAPSSILRHLFLPSPRLGVPSSSLLYKASSRAGGEDEVTRMTRGTYIRVPFHE